MPSDATAAIPVAGADVPASIQAAGQAPAIVAPVAAADPAAASQPAAAPAPAASTEPAATAPAEPQSPAPGVVEPPAAAKPAHTDTATLLEGVGTDPAAKPPEPAAAEVAKPAYEPFTLPEGIVAPPEQMETYTGILGELGVPQEAGQRLLDLHTATLKQFAEHVAADQHRVFADTRREWRNEVMADEELGGAGHDTAMGAVARARDKLVPLERRDEFNNFLRVTGAGDHPVFLRLLHAAAQFLDEPAPPPQGQVKPVPMNPRAAGGRRMIYDHPSSLRRQG